MIPSVGRIVHYYSGQGVAGAFVIRVSGPTVVDLQVFMTNGQIFHMTNVQQGTAAGTWNWPARV